MRRPSWSSLSCPSCLSRLSGLSSASAVRHAALALPVKLMMLIALLIAMPMTARAMHCMPLGSGGLMIGAYQPLQPTALDAQTSLAIECFPSVPGEALNLEVRLLNVVAGRLQLPNAQPVAPDSGNLIVQLYRDPARTLPVDEQTAIRFIDRPTIPTLYWVSLYARVPARQDTGVGQYRLPLTLFITY